jgi:hypothetical protein
MNHAVDDDPRTDLEDDDETPPRAIAVRSPTIPVTLSELAALKGQALEVIEARVQVLATLRKASIRTTSPEDWVLFKSPEEHGGQIVGYLQDAGADRVRDLYGIEVYGISKPEKIQGDEPGTFTYLITGSGRCRLTLQVVEEMEGGRSSTDDFCKGKSGAELELLVRKAARANLDGNITRELAGMKSVPMSDLVDAWVGTKKNVDQCRRGRGFGTRDDRMGGGERPDAGVEPPVCPVCRKAMVLRKGQKGYFYSCVNWKDHGKDAVTWDLEKWKAQPGAKKAASAPAATSNQQPATTTNGAKTEPVAPLHADEIDFGSGRRRREPGEEG